MAVPFKMDKHEKSTYIFQQQYTNNYFFGKHLLFLVPNFANQTDLTRALTQCQKGLFRVAYLSIYTLSHPQPTLLNI